MTERFDVDPIFLEIVKGTFRSMVLEMSLLLERTAMSPIIREKQDYAVGVFDRTGRLILSELLMQGPGMLDCVLQKYRLEDMQPGDIYCFNDPYLSEGAIGHVPDLNLCVPVFASDDGGRRTEDGRQTPDDRRRRTEDGRRTTDAGRSTTSERPEAGTSSAVRPPSSVLRPPSGPVAFVGIFGHYWDVGGIAAGSLAPFGTEIFHEGLLIPPIRLARAGVWNQDAYEIIVRNTRFPDLLEGDTRAVISACRTGEQRLLAFFDRYGVDRTLAAFDRLIEQNAERAQSLLLDYLPDGEYEFADYVDGDGISDRSFRVHVRVSKRDGALTLDLTGTDDQSGGAINFILHPAILTVVLLGRILQALDESIILNDGLREVATEIRLRPGSLLQPRFPAAVAHRAISRMVVNNCLLGVFGRATGGRAPAASSNYGVITLRALRSDGTYVYLFDGLGVGQGARPSVGAGLRVLGAGARDQYPDQGADGIDAIYLIGQKNNPVEFVEANYPFRVERFGVHADSGGPGTYRGGTGIVRDLRLLLPETTLSTILSSIKHPPFGARGGQPGRPGFVVVNPGTPDERRVETFTDNVKLRAGDLLRVATSGGGGWGNPLERDPELVARDVRRGYVTRAGAEADYGVVVDDRGVVDGAGTRRRREGTA